MKRLHRASLIFLAILGICSAMALADEMDESTKAALNSAESWLDLVDAGDYTASWQQAAEYFRNAVTEEQWRQALDAVRAPLGAAVTRKLKTTQHVTELPGAPDGDYVVIQFDTTFEHKKDAIETIAPMQQSDGTWRVSGYFIK